MKRTIITLAIAAAAAVGGYGYAQAAPTAVAEAPTATVTQVAAQRPAEAPVVVPATCPAQAPQVPAQPPAAPGASGLLNVNTATAEQLDALPVKGFGKARSQHVVEYRTAHGPFTSPAQLAQVPGMPADVAAQLAPLVVAP